MLAYGTYGGYSRKFNFMTDSTYRADIRLGIDLGGTKIEIVALDRSGNERFRKRVPTPQGDYTGTVRAIADLVAAATAETSSICTKPTLGVGIPGTISPATGLVKGANSVCLIGHPLDRDIEAASKTPTRLGNDANCFALSEASDGAGSDALVVFGAILGTGTGSGLVVDKKVISGPNAITGEWGHIRMPWATADETPGPECYCGLKGCLETFLSGPGLAAEFKRVTGITRSSEEIALEKDELSIAAMDRYVDRLARAYSTIINVIDPNIIVVGGGLSKIPRLYTDVPPLLEKYTFSDTVVTPIVPAKYGDSSGVRGAAWLWP
jgi:fructokinase